MVHGIATDYKKYKHKKMNDEKWLSKDMLVWKRFVERDIQQLGIKNDKEANKSSNNMSKNMLTSTRVFQILILGVLGPIILIAGIYFTLKVSFVVGLPFVLIGSVFLIALILNEKYR